MLLLLAALLLQSDPPPPPGYEALRYEEDWGFLRDPKRRSDPFDPLKFIPLDAEGDAYLTLGANLREQMEIYSQEDFGLGPTRDAYLLHRFYPYADVHFGRPARVFVMLKNAIAFDTQGPPFPSQQDSIDVHQAFVDLGVDTSIGRLTLRPGRQELLYGSGRLLDDRSGPNVKMTYDLVRVLLEQVGTYRVDAFYGRPVQPEKFGFDDGRRQDISLWGVYASGPVGPGMGVDAYYLGIQRRNWVFDEATDDALRHVVGARWFSQRGSELDWNVELLYQFGAFGDGGISAWGVNTDTGWTFQTLPWAPRIGCRADVLSGDRTNGDGELGTYDPFFPRGILQGEAGSFGPSNLIAVTPELVLQPSPALYLSARWTFYWRESLDDGLYSLNLGLLSSGAGSRERFIGKEISLTADWYAQRHVIVSTVYSFTDAGPYLRDTGRTRDQSFLSATLSLRF